MRRFTACQYIDRDSTSTTYVSGGIRIIYTMNGRTVSISPDTSLYHHTSKNMRKYQYQDAQ